MVGKMSFAGLRQRLSHVTSHDSYSSEHTFDFSSAANILNIRRHVPFFASPLDPKTTEWLNNKHATSNLTLKRRPTVAQQEASRVAGGIFRKQEEASPLELFFDLFFVANLAIYSFNHGSATATDVGNFIGFFSLMWTFWFNVVIHDVRFYVDSISNRVCKTAQFAIWTAFTGLGPLYNVIAGESGETETREFSGLALVFMTSRLFLLFQYSVVLYFVRPFKKTVLPLFLMMLIYLCSAMAFLGTYIEGSGHVLDGNSGVHHVVVWYTIVGVEALAVIVVSSVWRILSFKHTHLVERVGLLTLIIMGEGIIGVIKSISNILDGTSINIWHATGIVIAGVFLIYLIFVLYFTPIAHDRFGTIRQQIWVLLHYPLHVAILLTVDGSAECMLWTTIIAARSRLISLFPNLLEPSNGYATVNALITKVNDSMISTAALYTYLSLPETYDWLPDLDRIQNLTQQFEYASTEFNEGATEILGEMINETTNYFFENFKFEGPYEIESMTDANEILASYYGGMTVIFTGFYISSGILLLTLAAMYWIGKNNKTWEEYLAVVSRSLVGFGLPFITIAAYTQPWETGYMFSASGWLVSVVVLCYLFVTMVDNIFQTLYDRRFMKKVATGEVEAGTLEDLQKQRYNGAFGPHATISHEDSSSHATHKVNSSPNRKQIRFEELSRSTAGSGTGSGPGESDSLVSGEPTLSGHRDSEQPTPPPGRQPQRQERDWAIPQPPQRPPQRQQPYRLPSLGLDNLGDSRVDTEYRGHDGMVGDVERGDANLHRNNVSSEQETATSPTPPTDQGLNRP